MKKIFIIILLISVVSILSFLDLNAVFKNEFSYNIKMFVQMSIIITCLVFVFKLVLEIIDPNIFNTLKRVKSIKDDKKNKSVYPLKNQNVSSSKELDNYYKNLLETHTKKIEEKRKKEALEEKKISEYPERATSYISKVEKITEKQKTTIPKVKAEKQIIRQPLEKKKSESTNSNTTKRVNFSTDRIITSTTQYPVIRKPQQKSIIRSFRLGRNNRKGYKEEAFYNAIKKHFYNDFNVLDNVMLAIGEGTNPYEPDIAMISKGKQNIFIDIEIDEPYAGVSRKLTHCYPEDINRDNYFVDRGWFVIRFSEYQVHHQIEECLREIVKVIAAIHIGFNVGNRSSLKSIDKINCWDTNQAQQWELTNYRESYLNHTFKPYNEPKRIIDTALTLEEKLEEYLVKPSAFVEILKTKVRDVPAKKIVNERKVNAPIVPPTKKEFNSSNSKVSDLIEMAVKKEFAIEMKYTNYNGESSLRKISDLEYTEKFMDYGYENKEHFKGYCHNRESERSFRVSRINYMKVLN